MLGTDYLLGMRLPLKSNDTFANNLNLIYEQICDTLLSSLKPLIEMTKGYVMLGDGSVTQVDMFDKGKVTRYFEKFLATLSGWSVAPPSNSTTDDLHRLYCQVSCEVGKFYLYGYFGIQFHALPYYKVDKRVIEVQKELVQLSESEKNIDQSMSQQGDTAIRSELKKLGYDTLEFQELFSKLIDNPILVSELEKKASSIENQFPQYQSIQEQKSKLFEELNALIVEVYQISPVKIDYNKLMQGEEGVVSYFDIEVIKNRKTNERDAFINTQRVDLDLGKQVSQKLEDVIATLKRAIPAN